MWPGMAIRTSSAELYAIALAIPELRFVERFDLLLLALHQTKSEIGAALDV